MARIAAISSSPSTTSRTDAVLGTVTESLARDGHSISPVVLRDLPAQALLRADTSDLDVAHAVQSITTADAVVVTTPVYKASFSGLLKVFLDLLPQYALQGKAVLPLATGGTPAHVLVVDYALRPVLSSLGATHITPGWFVLSNHITVGDGGVVTLDDASGAPLREVTAGFVQAVARIGPPARTHAAVA